MTDENKKTTTSGTRKPRIPTREEFHKYAMPKLCESDFCTDYPPKVPGGLTNRIASSMRWTESLFNSVGQSWHWRYQTLDQRY